MRNFWVYFLIITFWFTGSVLYGIWTEDGEKRGEAITSVVNGGTSGSTGTVSQSVDGSILTLTFPMTSTGTQAQIDNATNTLTSALTITNQNNTFAGTQTFAFADIGIPYSTHSGSNLVVSSTILVADSWLVILYSTSDILLTNTTIIAAGRSGQQVQFRNVGNYDIILSARTNSGASLFLNGQINRTMSPNNTLSLSWCNIQGGWTLQSDPTSEISPSAKVLNVRNISGSSIPALSVVRISGYNSGLDRVTIELTSNTNPVTHKAIGVTPVAIPNNRNGIVVTFGSIGKVDTSEWSILNILHVGSIQGSLTNGIPSGTNQFRQLMAKVTRSGVGNGSIFVAGALQVNAVPSLIEDSTWQGVPIATQYLNSAVVVDTELAAMAGTNLDWSGAAFNLDGAAQASDDLADSAMQDLIDDTTPQLGGNLDLNSKWLSGNMWYQVNLREAVPQDGNVTWVQIPIPPAIANFTDSYVWQITDSFRAVGWASAQVPYFGNPSQIIVRSLWLFPAEDETTNSYRVWAQSSGGEIFVTISPTRTNFWTKEVVTTNNWKGCDFFIGDDEDDSANYTYLKVGRHTGGTSTSNIWLLGVNVSPVY